MVSIQEHKRGCLYSAIFTACFLLGSVTLAHAGIEADRSSAVIFVYQRVGEDDLPQSSISAEQFREHVQELKTEGYSVLPLDDIVNSLKNSQTLPQKTVAITFDGAWASVMNNAVPALEKAGLPFTVFFASEQVDTPGYASWKQLKALKKKKYAGLGLLPSSYAHMTAQSAEQNAALVNRAVARYRDEFGEAPAFFAYPYGEYSFNIQKQVESYSFAAAFGQQSGVAYQGSDFLALPRFIMTDAYGDLDRFLLTANALPLPVSDVIPADPLIEQNPPMIGFTVTPEISDLSGLSCFVSGQGKTPLSKVGDNRVEIRLTEPFDDHRTRINCTMPDSTVIPGEPQSWRWFSMLLTVKGFGEDSGDDASAGAE